MPVVLSNVTEVTPSPTSKPYPIDGRRVITLATAGAVTMGGATVALEISRGSGPFKPLVINGAPTSIVDDATTEVVVEVNADAQTQLRVAASEVSATTNIEAVLLIVNAASA